MRSFWVLLIVIGITYADNIDDEMMKNANHCIGEVGVDPSLVKKLEVHDYSSNDPKLKCFTKCFCIKSGICDASMNLNVQKIEDHTPEAQRHKMDDAIGACASLTGTDDCDTMYQKFKCYNEHIHA